MLFWIVGDVFINIENTICNEKNANSEEDTKNCAEHFYLPNDFFHHSSLKILNRKFNYEFSLPVDNYSVSRNDFLINFQTYKNMIPNVYQSYQFGHQFYQVSLKALLFHLLLLNPTRKCSLLKLPVLNWLVYLLN